MLTTKILAAAIIRISEPLKLLITCNIGTLTVPEHPKYKFLLSYKPCEIDLNQKPPSRVLTVSFGSQPDI
jgi:hypothetical protein